MLNVVGCRPVPSEDVAITDLVDRLRDRGWRMTAQRRVVAEVLVGEHVHLTAEAVHAAAQKRLPEVSLATVYNALNQMVAIGEVFQVSAGDGPKRYDPNVTMPHQHLVCIRCGDLRDVVPDGEDALRLRDSQRYGYRLVDIDILFRGICAACLQA